MHVLHVEPTISDFDAWRETFDSDPLSRQHSGVRRYRILRAENDPNYVMVDFEFDGPSEAETFRESLHELWRRLEMQGPRAERVLEVVDSKEY